MTRSTGRWSGFAESYADQNERDYAVLREAVASDVVAAEFDLLIKAACPAGAVRRSRYALEQMFTRRAGVRVMGVDPGLTRCGLSVIEGGAGRQVIALDVDVVRTPVR